MSHATVTRPAARPTAPAQAQTARQRRPLKTVSDFTIASAAAQATRMAPGVMDLSPGLFALAATYGLGQRVTGVVVHHLTPDHTPDQTPDQTPDTIALEIRVALSEAHCNMVAADAASDAIERETETAGILLEIASHIRRVVYESLRDISPMLLVQVDVFIDDLR